MDRGLVSQQAGVSPARSMEGLREYRLVIYPDIAAYNKLMAEKQRFSRRFGVDSVMKSFPAIVVACFYAREGMEETLIRWIQRICSLCSSFYITLNNYSGFPSHTIYLRITDARPFRQLARQLKSIDDFVFSSCGQPARLSQHPYLALAEELPAPVYERAMPFYSSKILRASFPANELVLLARDHPFAASKTVNVFHFSPGTQPVHADMARYITSLQKEKI
jgi:hypothetical protein